MRENIHSTTFGLDESEPFGVVEPLDSAFSHDASPKVKTVRDFLAASDRVSSARDTFVCGIGAINSAERQKKDILQATRVRWLMRWPVTQIGPALARSFMSIE
jgi:hypothetical protein